MSCPVCAPRSASLPPSIIFIIMRATERNPAVFSAEPSEIELDNHSNSEGGMRNLHVNRERLWAALIGIGPQHHEVASSIAPAGDGAGALAGHCDRENGLPRADSVTGVTRGGELARIGNAGPMPAGRRPVAAYFEAHIEQGPILEA